MKIAFIGQKGIPAVYGGVERHVEELATRLAGLGHEVIVYTRPNYTDKKLRRYKSVKLVSLPNVPTKNLDAITHTFFACLDLVIRRRKVEVIHFHSIGPSSLIWFLKLFLPRTPVIATFHTQCYYHKKWGIFARAYLKFGEWVSHNFADEVIAVSKTLKKYSSEKYKRIVNYIPNGVSTPSFVPAREIKKFGLEKDGYILTVSRLVRHKGIHHLIEAFNRLETDKKLVITGEGSYTDNYIKELKKLANNNPNIIFTGGQSGRTLEELLSNAYLFVQPSESEGLSIALLEAMSYGRGCLISDIPENLEAVGESGFVFKSKDVNELEKKLAEILNHPEEVKSHGQEAQARAALFYDWESVLAETIQVYEKELAFKKKFSSFSLAKALKRLIFFYR